MKDELTESNFKFREKGMSTPSSFILPPSSFMLFRSLSFLWSLSVFRRLVMLEQTLFGLPWVLATAVLALANPALPFPDLSTWLWMVIAFSAARSAGMAFNRLIDHEIDGKNPRTADRPLPMGLVTRNQVLAVAWGGVALFLLACGMLNSLCLMMAPGAVFLFWAYSYTKRFTSYCHFVLGIVQLLGPVFAWAAITGTFSLPALLIGGAVCASIAANDIIYAFQDEEFDRANGLWSIPVSLGRDSSILLVRLLHLFALCMLVQTGISLKADYFYFFGLIAMAAIYVYYHLQLRVQGPSRFFFMCNTLVALVFLLTSFGVLLWQRLL